MPLSKFQGQVISWNINSNNTDQDHFIFKCLCYNKHTPGVVFSQCDGDPADTVAGFHVSILNSLSELLLECQHLRDQFQQSVHISATHKHKRIQRTSTISIYETAKFNKIFFFFFFNTADKTQDARLGTLNWCISTWLTLLTARLMYLLLLSKTSVYFKSNLSPS